MENIEYIIIGCFTIALLIILIVYYYLKSTMVSRAQFANIKMNLEQAKQIESSLKERAEQYLSQNEELKKERDEYETNCITIAQEKNHFKAQNTYLIEETNKLSGKIVLYEGRIEELRSQIQSIEKEKSELHEKQKYLKEKLEKQEEEIIQTREHTMLKFNEMAQDLLEEKSEKFTNINKLNMDAILNPLKKDIAEFKDEVKKSYIDETKERQSLLEQVKQLASLNEQLNKNATNLTNALKGQSKVQGDWGEMILSRILEESGLEKDREYFSQESFVDENGNAKRPDVLVKQLHNKCIIIDSKVSLKAYEQYVHAEHSSEQEKYLKQHYKSVKKHIDELHAKSYDRHPYTLEFVILFIPIEPAYFAALRFDQDLWSYAYQKKIVLLGPANLLTALKVVADLWTREYQNQNAIEIAVKASKMYDKFVGFTESLDDVRKHLDKATQSHEEAMKRLKTGRGNLISKAKQLRKLGVKSQKKLDKKLLLEEE